jgi:hypothetical protein
LTNQYRHYDADLLGRLPGIIRESFPAVELRNSSTAERVQRQINKIRFFIEHVIVSLTDYRRPIETLATTISALIVLHFCKIP